MRAEVARDGKFRGRNNLCLASRFLYRCSPAPMRRSNKFSAYNILPCDARPGHTKAVVIGDAAKFVRC
jgi:hypothetical protein